MRKEYQLKQIKPGITLLYGFAEECCIYAVEGENRIALIDTGMGTGDLNHALETIAPGKEIIVFNTHCHFDHCGGNFQFPEVYLSPGSYADADGVDQEKDTLPREEEQDGLKRYDWKRVPVKDGDVFDLGGKTLEVIETPGHSPGCICLLDRADRVLFAGDLIGSDHHCTHMLAYVHNITFSTVSIETFRRSLEKVDALGEYYDGILGGHDDCLLGKEYLSELLRLSGEILDGSAKPYHPQLAPHYGGLVCWRLDGKNTAILYHDEVIFDRK